MKVKEQSKGEQISVNVNAVHNAKISSDKLHKLGSMLKNPYRNPIQSIVREITSNAFDAHREAGVERPIKITFSKDTNGSFISFQDFGTGMSPELIANVYSQYLQSTKEDTNDQLGYFGIGSKSPLSYQTHFHCITNYNGTKYHYVMRETETLPQTSLFNQTETEDENGTTIKIYFKDDSDSVKFVDAIKNQLTYFKEVVIIDELSGDLTDEWGSNYVKSNFIKNLEACKSEFKIYNAETFLFRPDNGFSNELHVVFDSVPYPINWKALGMGLIHIPVAIKMDIGEVMVTTNREDIQYTSDEKRVVDGEVVVVERGSIEIIKEKIKAVLAELNSLYQTQDFSCSDLVEWYEKKDNNKYLYLDNTEINLVDLFSFEGYETSVFYLDGLDNLKLNLKRLASKTRLEYQYKSYYNKKSEVHISEYRKPTGYKAVHSLDLNTLLYKKNDFNLVPTTTSLGLLERRQLIADGANDIYRVNPNITLREYVSILNLNSVDVSLWRGYINKFNEYIMDWYNANAITNIQVTEETKKAYQEYKASLKTQRAEGDEKFSILQHNGRFTHSFEKPNKFIKEQIKRWSGTLIIVGHTKDSDNLRTYNIYGAKTIMVSKQKMVDRLLKADRRCVHVDDVVNPENSEYLISFLKANFKMVINDEVSETLNEVFGYSTYQINNMVRENFSLPKNFNRRSYDDIVKFIGSRIKDKNQDLYNKVKQDVYNRYNYSKDAIKAYAKKYEFLQYFNSGVPKNVMKKIMMKLV